MKTFRVFLAFALCTASSLFAQEHRIQMRRAAKAGQQFHLTYRFQESHRVSASFAGQVSPEHKTNTVAELDGLIKVLETGPDGILTKASCTISNCVRIEEKLKRELLPPQTIVAVSAGAGGVKLLVNGKPVDAETQKVIGAAMQLGPVELAAGDILSSDKPRKVGESWDIDLGPLKNILKTRGLAAAEPEIQGRATLDSLTKVGDEDCLEFSSKIYLKKFTPPTPPGVQITQAFGAIRVGGKFPLDASLAALEESMEIDRSIIAQIKFGTNAVPVTTKTAMALKITLQRKYLK